MRELLLSWILLCLLFLLLMPLLARFVALITRAVIRRKLTNRTLIAEYVPPSDLTAAEAGYLFDNRFGKNEVLAAVLDLNREGIVSLTAEPGPDFILISTAGKENVLKTLDGIGLAVVTAIRDKFNGIAQWHQLSSADTIFAGTRRDFETEVVMQLQQKGYLRNGLFTYENARDRQLALLGSVILTVAFLTLPLNFPYDGFKSPGAPGFETFELYLNLFTLFVASMFAFGVFYQYCRLVIYIYFRNSGLPRGASHKLRGIWPAIEGHRIFIETVEYNRLKSDNNPLDPSYAWCIAYGLDPGLQKVL